MRCPNVKTPCRASGAGATVHPSTDKQVRVTDLCSPVQRLPAYGRKILALRAQGKAPQMAVLVLDGWNPTSNLEEYAPWVVIVPQDEPIESFDFRCLSGLFAFVLADGIRRMDEIALRVLEFRPVGVFGWTDELGSLAFYVQGAT